MCFENMPPEVVAEIIDTVVLSVGPYKALRLRSVSKVFHDQILRSLFYSKRCAIDPCNKYHTTSDKFQRMSPPLVSRLLVAQIELNRGGEGPLFQLIRMALHTLDDPQTDDPQRLKNLRIICQAAASARADLLKLLSEKEQSGSGTIYEQVPLSAAIIAGNITTVRRLLGEGADVNFKNPYFGRPLTIAAKSNHLEIIELLLDHGAKFYGVSWPTLSYQSWSCFERISSGDYFSSSGSVLQTASLAGHYDAVVLLLNPKYGHPTEGIEYERSIVAAARGGHLKTLQLLRERYTGVRHPYSLFLMNTRTFIEACCCGHEEIVRMMLDSGVSINTTHKTKENREHVTALHLAALHGHAHIIRLLLDRGANRDESITNKGPALSQAVKNGHQDAVQVFLEYGASIDGIDNISAHATAKRPFQVAADHGQLHMLRFLLRRGAHVDAKVGDGKYLGAEALSQAVSNGLAPVVHFLITEAGVPPEIPNVIYSYHPKHTIELVFKLAAQRKDEHAYEAYYDCGWWPPQKWRSMIDGIHVTRTTCEWVGRY